MVEPRNRSFAADQLDDVEDSRARRAAGEGDTHGLGELAEADLMTLADLGEEFLESCEFKNSKPQTQPPQNQTRTISAMR